eukprot:Rmarinus@m.14761
MLSESTETEEVNLETFSEKANVFALSIGSEESVRGCASSGLGDLIVTSQAKGARASLSVHRCHSNSLTKPLKVPSGTGAPVPRAVVMSDDGQGVAACFEEGHVVAWAGVENSFYTDCTDTDSPLTAKYSVLGKVPGATCLSLGYILDGRDTSEGEGDGETVAEQVLGVLAIGSQTGAIVLSSAFSRGLSADADKMTVVPEASLVEVEDGSVWNDSHQPVTSLRFAHIERTTVLIGVSESEVRVWRVRPDLSIALMKSYTIPSEVCDAFILPSYERGESLHIHASDTEELIEPVVKKGRTRGLQTTSISSSPTAGEKEDGLVEPVLICVAVSGSLYAYPVPDPKAPPEAVLTPGHEPRRATRGGKVPEDIMGCVIGATPKHVLAPGLVDAPRVRHPCPLAKSVQGHGGVLPSPGKALWVSGHVTAAAPLRCSDLGALRFAVAVSLYPDGESSDTDASSLSDRKGEMVSRPEKQSHVVQVWEASGDVRRGDFTFRLLQCHTHHNRKIRSLGATSIATNILSSSSTGGLFVWKPRLDAPLTWSTDDVLGCVGQALASEMDSKRQGQQRSSGISKDEPSGILEEEQPAKGRKRTRASAASDSLEGPADVAGGAAAAVVDTGRGRKKMPRGKTAGRRTEDEAGSESSEGEDIPLRVLRGQRRETSERKDKSGAAKGKSHSTGRSNKGKKVGEGGVASRSLRSTSDSLRSSPPDHPTLPSDSEKVESAATHGAHAQGTGGLDVGEDMPDAVKAEEEEGGKRRARKRGRDESSETAEDDGDRKRRRNSSRAAALTANARLTASAKQSGIARSEASESVSAGEDELISGLAKKGAGVAKEGASAGALDMDSCASPVDAEAHSHTLAKSPQPPASAPPPTVSTAAVVAAATSPATAAQLLSPRSDGSGPVRRLRGSAEKEDDWEIDRKKWGPEEQLAYASEAARFLVEDCAVILKEIQRLEPLHKSAEKGLLDKERQLSRLRSDCDEHHSLTEYLKAKVARLKAIAPHFTRLQPEQQRYFGWLQKAERELEEVHSGVLGPLTGRLAALFLPRPVDMDDPLFECVESVFSSITQQCLDLAQEETGLVSSPPATSSHSAKGSPSASPNLGVRGKLAPKPGDGVLFRSKEGARPDSPAPATPDRNEGDPCETRDDEAATAIGDVPKDNKEDRKEDVLEDATASNEPLEKKAAGDKSLNPPIPGKKAAVEGEGEGTATPSERSKTDSSDANAIKSDGDVECLKVKAEGPGGMDVTDEGPTDGPSAGDSEAGCSGEGSVQADEGPGGNKEERSALKPKEHETEDSPMTAVRFNDSVVTSPQASLSTADAPSPLSSPQNLNSQPQSKEGAASPDSSSDPCKPRDTDALHMNSDQAVPTVVAVSATSPAPSPSAARSHAGNKGGGSSCGSGGKGGKKVARGRRAAAMTAKEAEAVTKDDWLFGEIECRVMRGADLSAPLAASLPVLGALYHSWDSVLKCLRASRPSEERLRSLTNLLSRHPRGFETNRIGIDWDADCEKDHRGEGSTDGVKYLRACPQTAAVVSICQAVDLTIGGFVGTSFCWGDLGLNVGFEALSASGSGAMNAALVAASYAVRVCGLRRVAIVDLTLREPGRRLWLAEAVKNSPLARDVMYIGARACPEPSEASRIPASLWQAADDALALTMLSSVASRSSKTGSASSGGTGGRKRARAAAAAAAGKQIRKLRMGPHSTVYLTGGTYASCHLAYVHHWRKALTDFEPQLVLLLPCLDVDPLVPPLGSDPITSAQGRRPPGHRRGPPADCYTFTEELRQLCGRVSSGRLISLADRQYAFSPALRRTTPAHGLYAAPTPAVRDREKGRARDRPDVMGAAGSSQAAEASELAATEGSTPAGEVEEAYEAQETQFELFRATRIVTAHLQALLGLPPTYRSLTWPAEDGSGDDDANSCDATPASP